MANLSDPENEELIANVNEQGYELTNATGDLGELTSVEARVLSGASNFSGNDGALYTFDLFDSPEELAAEGNETILEQAEVIRIDGDASLAELNDILDAGGGNQTLLKLIYTLADTPENLDLAPDELLSKAVSISARYEVGAEPITITLTPGDDESPDVLVSVTGFKLDDQSQSDTLNFKDFELNSEDVGLFSEVIAGNDPDLSDYGLIKFDIRAKLPDAAAVEDIFYSAVTGPSINDLIAGADNQMVFLLDRGGSASEAGEATDIWLWSDLNSDTSVQAAELDRIGELLGISRSDFAQLTNININLPEPDSSLIA